MTLNISVVSKSVVCLSSDFRLTYKTQGSASYYTDHEAQKIVLFSTLKFIALVQFCGLAKIGSFDTSNWLARISHELPKNAPVADLLSRLREVNPFIKGHRLTFTVAGFEGDKVFAHLVSNYQHIDPSRDNTIQGVLTRSTLQVRGVHSFATGERQFVDPMQLRAIRRLVKGNADPKHLRERLAAINAQAASKAGADGSISTACFAGHLTKQKKGEIAPYGLDEGQEYLPEFVMAPLKSLGTVLVAKLDDLGNPLPRRFIGMTLAVGYDEPNTPVETMITLAAFRNVQDPKTIGGMT